MRLLCYVNGVLTVISGDKRSVVENAEKPSFISGHAFYYEPTLKQMDGKSLTTTDMVNADNFITNYEFSTEESTPVVPSEVSHLVDVDGNYLGMGSADEGIVVPSAPSDDMESPYWTGHSYEGGVLVDKVTNKIIGVGDTRVTKNAYYAPMRLVDTAFDMGIQTYDKVRLSFSIDLENARKAVKNNLRVSYDEQTVVTLKSSEYGALEPTSFFVQVGEANNYKANSETPTPFIDGLLEGRAIDGETKDSLVTTILRKSEEFKLAAKELGRYQSLLKDADNASSVTELKKIKF